MKIAVFSNVNLDLLLRTLKKNYDVFESEGYGQWASYALEKHEALLTFQPKFIFLLLDGGALLENCVSYEDGKNEIDRSIAIVRQMAENYPQSIIVPSSIDVPKRSIREGAAYSLERMWEADWLRSLEEVSEKHANMALFPLKAVVEREGRAAVYSDKMWYMGSMPYSMKAIGFFAGEAGRLIEGFERTRKKVLVIDLDNTIWGGAVGEEGPENIELGHSLVGAAYRDTQKRIREIGKTGILLAVVSKNNAEDVDAVFKKNPHMVLKKEDFVDIITNWEPKTQNIQALAQTLSLGLDSFVFLDDNEVEREAVRINLPEVYVAEFPKDITRLPQTVAELYDQHFWCWKQTNEDKSKTQQYRQEALRKKDLAAAETLDDYIKSLDIQIVIQQVCETQYTRAVQLLGKTNQFNTNTLRMDMQQFLQYKESANHYIYVANVSDRYGDSGLVAELMLRIDAETAYIDNFLMSCRVMGRQIEHAFIYKLAGHLARQGVKTVRSSYIYTQKNKPVESLWDRLGFTLISQSASEKQYALPLPIKGEALLDAQWLE